MIKRVNFTPSQRTWREVPQARFLSWTPGEQLAYMTARDRDSAEHADDGWWYVFYTERAKQWVMT